MDVLQQFHFLRPWFLLLIPALALLGFWLSKQTKQQTGFEQWIDPQLLSHISTAEQRTGKSFRHILPYGLLGLAWLVVSLALAGPTWKQLPQPLHQSEQAMIVVLDLSPSMLAEDIAPSRIVRARLKIQDLLTQRKDGLTALVVYAGEAHTVTPLTDDNRTIINLLSTLTPGLLPIPGSNIEMAMSTATQLITDSGLTQASIVLLTDGIDTSALTSIKKTVGSNNDIYIVGIGTEKGAPIPTAAANNNTQGGFLRDGNNKIITAHRDEETLKSLAQDLSGYYLPLQADNSDIEFIITRIDSAKKVNQQETRQLERNMDQWEEIGPLLLLLFLPFFAFMFRRGWLLTICIGLSPMMIPETAHALSWDDIWLNQNQRAQKAFKEEQYEQAEKSFNQHQWQGSAAYKNKNYKGAIEAFSQGDTATDHYNKGNALSYLGEYDKAIKAYDTALKKDPNFADAQKNKNIIEELKKQQEQSQPSQDGDKTNDQENDQENKDEENNEQQDSQENQQSSGEDDKESDDSSSKKQDQQAEDEPKESESTSNENNNEEEPEDAQPKAEEKTDPSDEDKKEAQESTEQQEALPHLSEEEKQELEQWIRKIPDDPSGLLRRKFEYEFQKRKQLYQSGQWTLPDNNAHQRY